jgi:hypothetical protein
MTKPTIATLTQRLSAQIAEFQREFREVGKAAEKAAEQFSKTRGPKWKRPDAKP